MPEEVTITGNIGAGKDPNGVDIIVVAVSPFKQFVIPLPDELPPGAPAGSPSARQLVKDHLNSGIQVAQAKDVPLPGRVVQG
jgi:hypothetical protein